VTDHTPNQQRRPWREELAARVTPEALRAYLVRTGWRCATEHCDGTRYRVVAENPLAEGYKIVFPLWESRRALGRFWKAFEALSSVENRNPADIVADICGEPTAETLLRNLLAVIHRDGGQYCEAHGIAKATADAVTAVNEMRGRGESRMPCGHPASAATGKTTRYCGTCALVAEGRRLLHELEAAEAAYAVPRIPDNSHFWIALEDTRAKFGSWAGDNLAALLDAAESGGGEPLPAGTGHDGKTGSPAAPAARADSPGAAPAAPSSGVVEAAHAVVKQAEFGIASARQPVRKLAAALAAHDAGTLALAADGTLPVPEGTQIDLIVRGVYRMVAGVGCVADLGGMGVQFWLNDAARRRIHPVVRLAAPQPAPKPEGGAS